MMRPPPNSPLFPSPTPSRSLTMGRARHGETAATIRRCHVAILAFRAGVVAVAILLRFDFPATAAGRVFSPVFPVVVGKSRSEEHTSELQSPDHLLCLLLLQK